MGAEAMSGRLSNLRTRLAKVERQVADTARCEKLANCNCRPQGEDSPSIFVKAEEFEAAANLPCPTHGIRRLGRLSAIVFGRTPTAESAKLIQLMEEYELRISQLAPLSSELEDDFEEF
jgi:hypothetical protein